MKFLLTKEVGRLATWLRILGFDARYEPSGNESYVILQAIKEERALVTRNQRYGRRRGGSIVFIKDDEVEGQLRELFAQLHLTLEAEKLFSRCTLCNKELMMVDKNGIQAKVPEYIFDTTETFSRCPECGKIYWKGSHWGNVQEAVCRLGFSLPG